VNIGDCEVSLMQDIVEHLRSCVHERKTVVLATIVATDGSVYRRAGARCLLYPDGRTIGIVSGGCVEQDLLEHAASVFESGRPKLVEYDFRADDGQPWGLGLGCNGALTLWIQRVQPSAGEPLAEKLLDALEERLTRTVPSRWATVLESSDEAKYPLGTLLELPQEIVPNDSETCSLQRAELAGVSVLLFVENLSPRPRLVVYGAGADSVPLLHIGKFLGWHVTLVDHRDAWLDREANCLADERILVRRDGYGTVAPPASAAAVVMTHHYESDRQILGHLLPLQMLYIGQLGPRHRTARMLSELVSSGQRLLDDDLEKLHAPIGLDVGAETPEEIALCVSAEILARRNRRDGGPLRHRSGPWNMCSPILGNRS
jgi:xanthine dehydrogenase accessory factor